MRSGLKVAIAMFAVSLWLGAIATSSQGQEPPQVGPSPTPSPQSSPEPSPTPESPGQDEPEPSADPIEDLEKQLDQLINPGPVLNLIPIPNTFNLLGAGGNPYGCYGQSDDPHLSDTQQGYVHAQSRTACPGFANRHPLLGVAAVLTRDRWYGQQTLDEDQKQQQDSREVEITLTWRCAGAGTYTYRIYGDHWMVGRNNQPYDGHTYNYRRFTC